MIYFFKVDFCITFYNYKKPINVKFHFSKTWFAAGGPKWLCLPPPSPSVV